MGARHVRWRSARLAPGIAAILVATAIAGRATAAAPAPQLSQLLVRFSHGTPSAQMRSTHEAVGAHLLRHLDGVGYDLVSAPDSALAAYRALPVVAVAEPNYAARAAIDPGDPCVSGACPGSTKEYSLDLINARAGWSLVPGKFLSSSDKLATPRTLIAVLDSKVDPSNPDFTNPGSSSSDVRNGGQLDLADVRDWVPASKQSGSMAYHGSYVAGIAAASANNGHGIAGIGYNATVLPLAVLAGDGSGDAASIAEAIVYAWSKGARVINLSLGIIGDSQAVHDAIKKVTTSANPSLVVAAAGNNVGSSPFYPGSYPESMSVAGTNAADQYAYCSDYNSNVSVSAPGEAVVSLAPMPNELATPLCGTSAATPHVSGLAALLFAQNPARTPAQVRTIIERSAEDRGAPGKDVHFGNGRINVERALRYGDGTPTVSISGVTVPRATGGSSIVTAAATGAAGITRAEIRVDSPNAAPIAMTATDGAFGGTTEQIRGTIPVPTSMPAGMHPVWVRAFDGTSWGPSSVSSIIVDRTPPALPTVSATYGVRATNEPVRVTFTATDNISRSLALIVQAVQDGSNSVVFQGYVPQITAGDSGYVWQPGASVLPGKYTIRVIVYDDAGNGSSKFAGTVVT